jgi:SNF2 family DNA or RNA helicase
MDLWAEVFLIDGGERLGRFIGQYRETFFRPAGMNPHTGVVYSYTPLPGAEEKIYQRIADVAVSMKAKDYLHMPECLMVHHEAVLDSRETKLYETMAQELLVNLEDDTIDAANAAVLSGKLLQMANGAVYSEDHEMKVLHDRKLEILSDLIEQANGQSVLVAYWYRHDHERIRKHLTEMGYEPRDLKTEADIRDWNAGKIPVAAIHPASAGHGLNLQAGGSTLVWFGLTWSLELYLQTNARLWRQGQQAETVVIHHLVTEGTIDERILTALKKKDRSQESLIDAVKAILIGTEGGLEGDRKALQEGGAA